MKIVYLLTVVTAFAVSAFAQISDKPKSFVAYTDKFNLTYVIVDENGDDKYRKGDLFYIEYRNPTMK